MTHDCIRPRRSVSIRTFLPLRMSERRGKLLGIGDALMLAIAVIVALWLWTVRGDLDYSLNFVAEQAQWFVILGGLWTLTAILFASIGLR